MNWLQSKWMQLQVYILTHWKWLLPATGVLTILLWAAYKWAFNSNNKKRKRYGK